MTTQNLMEHKFLYSFALFFLIFLLTGSSLFSKLILYQIYMCSLEFEKMFVGGTSVSVNEWDEHERDGEGKTINGSRLPWDNKYACKNSAQGTSQHKIWKTKIINEKKN